MALRLRLTYGGGTISSTQQLPKSEPLKWSQHQYHLATQQKWRCSDPTWICCPGRTQGWGPWDCVLTSSPDDSILNRSKIHMTKSPLRNIQSCRFYTFTVLHKHHHLFKNIFLRATPTQKKSVHEADTPHPHSSSSCWPQICLLSLWICLVWTFRVNGTFQCVTIMSGFFQHVFKGHLCCSTLSTSFISMTE